MAAAAPGRVAPAPPQLLSPMTRRQKLIAGVLRASSAISLPAGTIEQRDDRAPADAAPAIPAKDEGRRTPTCGSSSPAARVAIGPRKPAGAARHG
jgi:hypothetical protein